MSEQKVKCEKCGKDNVSANVEAYSREHFDGHVYCYDCQQLVDGRSDVSPEEEAKKGTLEEGKKEENKGTLNSFGGGANASDEELEEYDGEVGTELEAEAKEVNEKIIALVTAMSVPDESNFYAWLESEYGVKKIADLALQDKRKVREEMERGTAKMSEKKVIEPEVVDEEEELKWHVTVEIDEGRFSFKDGDNGVLLCKSGDKEYELRVDIPECSCRDYPAKKKKHEWCKHLKAASVLNYPVKEFPKVPEEIKNVLAAPEKSRRSKVKREEVVAITILNKEIEIPIQTPSNMIMSEDKAMEMIKGIIGNTPKKDDVIESYAGIEELNADVVLSLCSYLGIQYRIVEKEIEKARMSVGKIYELTATEEQMRKYGAVAKIMPEVDIVTRCKVTVAAAWKDKSGNTRISVGVKEELLTPFELSDISKRGVNFIEAKAITKASKKALLSVLPITHDGLKSKIKEAYHWK